MCVFVFVFVCVCLFVSVYVCVCVRLCMYICMCAPQRGTKGGRGGEGGGGGGFSNMSLPVVLSLCLSKRYSRDSHIAAMLPITLSSHQVPEINTGNW